MPARGARPERGDVGTRIGDFVSGGFRREGMGAPGIGDSPAATDCFTASAIDRCPFALGNSELSCVAARLRVPVSGMPYPERDLAGNSYSRPSPRVRRSVHVIGSLPEQEGDVYVQPIGQRRKRVNEHFAGSRFDVFKFAFGDS